MSEKVWLKAGKILVRASGNPLFKANDTMIELLKTLLTEEQAHFLLNFRNPRLTLKQLREKTDLSDTDLAEMLNSLMDEGIIMDAPNRTTGVTQYQLLAPVPDIFEYSLVTKGTMEKKKKLAQVYEKIFKEAIELSQKNYEGLLPIFREQLPAFSRIVPIEEEIIVPREVTLPSYEASKIIDQYDIISLSECPCKLERALLDDPCKTTNERFRCFHFGNLGRFFIEHGYGNSVSKEDAKVIIKEAADEGLVHKVFHQDFDVKNEEVGICNCCKCCCIIFQTYYRGAWPFHTMTSYKAELNESKCVGCGVCVEKCPIEAISLIDGTAHDDENKCIGCGVCVHHCPEEARSIKRTALRKVFIPAPKLAK